jgi:hypothetical protein
VTAWRRYVCCGPEAVNVAVIDAMQERLDRRPDAMRIRRATVEQGATHFRTRTLDKVRTEMSLHVLAYNLKRVVAMLARSR